MGVLLLPWVWQGRALGGRMIQQCCISKTSYSFLSNEPQWRCWMANVMILQLHWGKRSITQVVSHAVWTHLYGIVRTGLMYSFLLCSLSSFPLSGFAALGWWVALCPVLQPGAGSTSAMYQWQLGPILKWKPRWVLAWCTPGAPRTVSFGAFLVQMATPSSPAPQE